MTAIIRSWTSALTHITDTKDQDATALVTRCGRTLKNFQLHYPGESECRRCGNGADFSAVYEQRRLIVLEEQRRRAASDKEQLARKDERVSAHRRHMEEFEIMLKATGARIIKYHQRPAGGSIEFEVGDLKFKLTGNIW